MRIGCIGCPMGGGKCQKKEFLRYPKYKDNYIRAFDRMIKKQRDDGVNVVWKSGEECFKWWVGDDHRQISFDDYDEDWYLI